MESIINERKTSIENNLYEEYVKNIFQTHKFENDFSSFDFNKYILPIPHYEETEKYGLLYANKQLSSWVTQYFNNNNLSIINNKNHWQDVYTQSLMYNTNKISIDEYQNYKLLLSGKSKLDLILIIRNPVYKFISGILEDIQGQIKGSIILQNQLKQKFKDFDINKIRRKEISLPILREMTHSYLTTMVESESSVTFSHTNLYNNSFFCMLNSNKKIDLNKLKIIDLDNPNINIDDVFKSYYPESITSDVFWSNRNYYKTILEVIREIQNNNYKVFSVIQRDIHRDYYYYTLIKKIYKNNLIQ